MEGEPREPIASFELTWHPFTLRPDPLLFFRQAFAGTNKADLCLSSTTAKKYSAENALAILQQSNTIV